MIKRGYKTQESLIRYWVDQAVELCRSIDDDSLTEFIPEVEEAAAGLAHDRRVLVFGAEGCGKSALLAGISGCPVIAKAKVYTPCVRWRYLCRDGDSENSRFLPEDALDGLELVDTKACADEETAAVVRGLIPGADVVIAAVDTRAVKDSPVWDILAELPKEKLSTCLLSATFTDKCSAEASLNIAKNLQEFCKERLGAVPRICVCNPTSEQSITSFSTRVQEVLDGENGVRASLRHLAEKGMELVRKQGRVLNARAAVTRTDIGFLSNIEQEIDNFLARQEQGIPTLVDSYSAVARTVVPRLQRDLRHTLGYTFSPITLLRLERLASGTEKYLYDMVCREILDMQFETDRQFVLSCAAHWKSVRPRMERTLACEIGDFPEESLSKALANLRAGLCHDLREPFLSLQLRHKLAGVFLAPTGWMLVVFWIICGVLFVGGVMGFLGFDGTALACVGSASGVWAVGSLIHYFATRRILAHVASHTGALSDGLRRALDETIGGFIVSRVAAYRFLYVKPRQTVSLHETMLAPLQERYKFINMQLSANAQRL